MHVTDIPLYQGLTVFSGNAHPALAGDICDYLEVPLGQCEVFEFSNENVFVRFCENIRARDVYLVQPICSPVNTRLMELFIMIDAAKRASAGRITAVVPYYAYGRSGEAASRQPAAGGSRHSHRRGGGADGAHRRR